MKVRSEMRKVGWSPILKKAAYLVKGGYWIVNRHKGREEINEPYYFFLTKVIKLLYKFYSTCQILICRTDSGIWSVIEDFCPLTLNPPNHKWMSLSI